MAYTEDEMRWQQIRKNIPELYQAAVAEDIFTVLARVQEIEIIARAIQRQAEINEYHEKK